MADATWKHHALRSLAFAVGLFTLAGAGGCAARGQMNNVWRDPTLVPNSIHKVFVVAIRKDPVRRRLWEDAFAGALAERGVAATVSYREFSDSVPDTQQVIDFVRQGGYDAVLVSTRLPDQATSHHVAGMIHEQEVVAPNYSGYVRFHTYWAAVQDPGYTETDTIVRVQTDLWSAEREGGHLVWSGTLSTLESVAGQTVKRAVDEEIMPELAVQGVVPEKAHR